MDYMKHINEELEGCSNYTKLAEVSSGIESELYRAMAHDEECHAHWLMKIAQEHGTEMPADHPSFSEH